MLFYDMKKISIYIDGSNFYFSIKNKFNSKVNIEKFVKSSQEKTS